MYEIVTSRDFFAVYRGERFYHKFDRRFWALNEVIIYLENKVFQEKNRKH